MMSVGRQERIESLRERITALTNELEAAKLQLEYLESFSMTALSLYSEFVPLWSEFSIAQEGSDNE